MQAYFEPEQAFSISMPQPVFEILIAYIKNMYAIPTVIFADYKHRRQKTIKVSHYHAAQFLPACLFIPTSPFMNFGDFCQPPSLFRTPLLFETRE